MSYFKLRNFLLVLALALALVLLFVISLRYNPSSQLETIVKSLPEGVDVSLEDIDYTHIEDGQPRWRLVSNQVERNAATGLLGLEGPELKLFDEQGQLSGSVRALRGDVGSDYRVVNLSGEVVLNHSSGYTLQTESLTYNHATQEVTTDAPVLLQADGLRLAGRGLTFYLKEELLQLHAEVEGLLDPSKMQ